MNTPVTQAWVADLSMMQQTVLFTAIRGPDGVAKYGPTKMLLRWYRRCILFSAMDGRVLTNPLDPSGGSFTGPSVSLDHLQDSERLRRNARRDNVSSVSFPSDDLEWWDLPIEMAIARQMEEAGWEPLLHEIVGDYLKQLDAIPHHFQLHLLHAIEILGYKHPEPRVRAWWMQTYFRLVHDMHLWPETEEQLDRRLGDDRDQWLERNDPATVD